MVHSYREIGRMRYGPGFARLRHDDGGNPSSNTKYQASLRALAKRYGINPKTVAKWKKREGVADRPTGPREPKSTSLTVDDEAIVVAFRKHTQLPLDHCLTRCRRQSRISTAPANVGTKLPKHM